LSIFKELDAKVWIAGGWGVDALVGQQTRQHHDVDIAFNTQQEETIIEKFTSLAVTVEEDDRPTRFVLRHTDGREIDMHPVAFDEAGNGRQLVPGKEPFFYPNGCFTEGFIHGRQVPCLTAQQLVTFHLGYTPLEKDKHNIKMLHQYLD